MPRLIPWSASRPTPSISRRSAVVRGLHLPASRAPRCPSSSSTAVPTAPCATAGRPNTQLLRQDQQTKLIVVAADQARGGPPEPARHRLGQGRGGARRLGLLECLSRPLGDDRRGVVRQHVDPGRGLVRRGRYAAGPLGLRPQDRDPRQVQLLQSQAAPDVRQGGRADHLLRGDLHDDLLGEPRPDARATTTTR